MTRKLSSIAAARLARISGQMNTPAQQAARSENLKKARARRAERKPQPPGPGATTQEIWRYNNRDRLLAYARAYYVKKLRAKRQEAKGK